jgi:DNA-binding PadR family transcriptional regulator
MRDELHGTLDALVLKTLSHGARHGYAIAQWLREQTNDALHVEEGSLYPALYRMERDGWI